MSKQGEFANFKSTIKIEEFVNNYFDILNSDPTPISVLGKQMDRLLSFVSQKDDTKVAEEAKEFQQKIEKKLGDALNAQNGSLRTQFETIHDQQKNPQEIQSSLSSALKSIALIPDVLKVVKKIEPKRNKLAHLIQKNASEEIEKSFHTEMDKIIKDSISLLITEKIPSSAAQKLEGAQFTEYLDSTINAIKSAGIEKLAGGLVKAVVQEIQTTLNAPTSPKLEAINAIVTVLKKVPGAAPLHSSKPTGNTFIEKLTNEITSDTKKCFESELDKALKHNDDLSILSEISALFSQTHRIEKSERVLQVIKLVYKTLLDNKNIEEAIKIAKNAIKSDINGKIPLTLSDKKANTGYQETISSILKANLNELNYAKATKQGSANIASTLSIVSKIVSLFGAQNLSSKYKEDFASLEGAAAEFLKSLLSNNVDDRLKDTKSYSNIKSLVKIIKDDATASNIVSHITSILALDLTIYNVDTKDMLVNLALLSDAPSKVHEGIKTFPNIASQYKNEITEALNKNPTQGSTISVLREAIIKSDSTEFNKVLASVDFTKADNNSINDLVVLAASATNGFLTSLLDAIPQDKINVIINTINAKGSTPLIEAVKVGNLENIKLLLDKGAKNFINIAANDGSTALTIATQKIIEAGNDYSKRQSATLYEEIAKLLILQYGADVTSVMPGTNIPIYQALLELGKDGNLKVPMDILKEIFSQSWLQNPSRHVDQNVINTIKVAFGIQSSTETNNHNDTYLHLSGFNTNLNTTNNNPPKVEKVKGKDKYGYQAIVLTHISDISQQGMCCPPNHPARKELQNQFSGWVDIKKSDAGNISSKYEQKHRAIDEHGKVKFYDIGGQKVAVNYTKNPVIQTLITQGLNSAKDWCKNNLSEVSSKVLKALKWEPKDYAGNPNTQSLKYDGKELGPFIEIFFSQSFETVGKNADDIPTFLEDKDTLKALGITPAIGFNV
jgi:ankyrin repeat protein